MMMLPALGLHLVSKGFAGMLLHLLHEYELLNTAAQRARLTQVTPWYEPSYAWHLGDVKKKELYCG